MRTMTLTLAATLALTLVGTSSALVIAQKEAAANPSAEGLELLPGVELVTEEVEAGVYRVVSDGVRELAWSVEPETRGSREPPGYYYWREARRPHIAANEDGVWLGRPGGIVRLGAEGPVWSPAEDSSRNLAQTFEVAPDGTLYVQRDPALILGKDGWRKVTRPRVRGFDFPPSGWRGSIQFGPDGSRWVRGNTDKDTRNEREAFARRDADGWSLVKVPLPRPKMRSWPAIEQAEMTPGGGVVVLRGSQFVQRYDGTRWKTLPRPDNRMMRLLVSTDGSVWAQSWAEDFEGLLFHSLDVDGDGWTAHEFGVMHPMSDHWSGQHGTAGAGSDGAIWFTPGDGAKEVGRCDGIARYNGNTADRFLRGLCVYDLAFGPDGDVWVLGGLWTGSVWDPDDVGPVEPYVITSEAVTVGA